MESVARIRARFKEMSGTDLLAVMRDFFPVTDAEGNPAAENIMLHNNINQRCWSRVWMFLHRHNGTRIGFPAVDVLEAHECEEEAVGQLLARALRDFTVGVMFFHWDRVKNELGEDSEQYVPAATGDWTAGY